MKTFRIWAKITSYAYLDVEAETEADAIKIAEEADGGEFNTCEDGDWEIFPDGTEI